MAFKANLETVRSDILEMTRQLGKGGFLEGVAAEEFQSGAAAFEGLPLGAEIPPFELSDLDGKTVTTRDLLGQQTFLVNWSPTCGFCARIAPEIAELQPELRDRGVRTVFISSGTRESLREQVEEFSLDIQVLIQEELGAEIFSGMGTPAAYLIDGEGKTASKLAYGADAVPILVRKAAGRSGKANGSKSKTAKKSTGSKKRAASKK
jgi:peroxiredoxin